MRTTKYHQIALGRLAASLEVEVLDWPNSGRGHVRVDLSHRVPERYADDEWMKDGFIYTGSKKLVLARLVMAAQDPPSVGFELTREQVKDAIRYRRIDDDTGINAHEFQAIRMVTLEVMG